MSRKSISHSLRAFVVLLIPSIVIMAVVGIESQYGSASIATVIPRESDFYMGGFDNPRGISLTKGGRLLVADSGSVGEPGSGRIVSVGKEGDFTQIVTGISNVVSFQEGPGYLFGVSDVAEFGNGFAVAIGEEGWLESPLKSPNQVALIDSVGEMKTFFNAGFYEQSKNPDGEARDSNVAGIAATPDGGLWVSDAAGNWIALVSSTGIVRRIVAFPRIGGVDAVPTGVAVDPKLDIAYVTLFRCADGEEGKGALVVIDSDGHVRTLVDNLHQPLDVALDSLGRVYVLEFSTSWQPSSGRVLLFANGESHVLIDRLNYPTSITVDGTYSIYVSQIMGPAGGEPGSGSILRFDNLGDYLS